MGTTDTDVGMGMDGMGTPEGGIMVVEAGAEDIMAHGILSIRLGTIPIVRDGMLVGQGVTTSEVGTSAMPDESGTTEPISISVMPDEPGSGIQLNTTKASVGQGGLERQRYGIERKVQSRPGAERYVTVRGPRKPRRLRLTSSGYVKHLQQGKNVQPNRGKLVGVHALLTQRNTLRQRGRASYVHESSTWRSVGTSLNCAVVLERNSSQGKQWRVSISLKTNPKSGGEKRSR